MREHKRADIIQVAGRKTRHTCSSPSVYRWQIFHSWNICYIEGNHSVSEEAISIWCGCVETVEIGPEMDLSTDSTGSCSAWNPSVRLYWIWAEQDHWRLILLLNTYIQRGEEQRKERWRLVWCLQTSFTKSKTFQWSEKSSREPSFKNVWDFSVIWWIGGNIDISISTCEV